MDTKTKNVVEFYKLTNTLKDKIRSGWIKWNVNKERLESIAEHIYGTCMLAIAMKSEFNADIDITKVIKMLVVHESEEIIIGDITPYDNVTQEEKLELGKKAVADIFKDLNDGQDYINIIEEFDKRETSEALFAHMCDKLECDLQAQMYENEGCMNLNDERNEIVKFTEVKEIIESGAKNIAQLFNHCDRKHYVGKEGEPFMELLNYLDKENNKENE